MVKDNPLTYASVGVDVEVEALAAKILYEASKITWSNRRDKIGKVLLPKDSFSGLKYIDVADLPAGTVMFGGSDGVATKALIAAKLQKFDTLAYDLLAMVCDDAVIRGGEPVLLKSVLDVNTLGTDKKRLKYIRQLAKGYQKAAQEAGVVIINGELAQLGETIGELTEFHLSWSADVTWFAHKSRLISGASIRPGMKIVALREQGVRCNGLSLLRRAFEKAYGPQWFNKSIGPQTLGTLTLRPSVIYTSVMLAISGGYSLKRQPQAPLYGAAHITGGGLPEKMGRLLAATGHGAKLDNLFTPGKVLQLAQKAGDITDREAYGAWNMGQGMMIVTDDPQKVIKVAARHRMSAKIAGSIIPEPKIIISSKGVEQPGQELVFEL